MSDNKEQNETILPLLTEYFETRGWALQKVDSQNYLDPELITHILRSSDSNEQVAVKFLDWTRSVGTDQAIRLQRFCELNSISGILVSKKIGENTIHFCNRHQIVTLTEEDLQNFLSKSIISPSSQ